jgi:hypothetical protein
MSTAIQLLPFPSQFQQAMPERAVPPTTAEPGHRKPHPAGRAKPCSATHWRAAAQRSTADGPEGGATGAAAAVVGGAVATVLWDGAAVVVTGLGFTVVDVLGTDVVEVVVVGAAVLEVVVGSAWTVTAAATTGVRGVAAAPPARHASAAPASASTLNTAPTLNAGRLVVPARGIRTCRRVPEVP